MRTYNNGQIAKAIRGDNVETFEWDGLALIERSGTKYVNEPHIGGGNPVLAVAENTETIFTDILGTSLGKIEDGGYLAIDKTSFGVDSSDKSSFFTGKPYVEDLGYAFLLRNYRSDIGKWLTQDLIGYPDGWNNLAYCNNRVSSCIDLFGADIYYLCDKSAVKGLGHAAMIIGNNSMGYHYYSFGSGNGSGSGASGSSNSSPGGSNLGSGSGSSSTIETMSSSSLSGLLSSDDLSRYKNDKEYVETIQFKTNEVQDVLAFLYAEDHSNDAYSFVGYNCLDFVKGALKGANVEYKTALTPKGFFYKNE